MLETIFCGIIRLLHFLALGQFHWSSISSGAVLWICPMLYLQSGIWPLGSWVELPPEVMGEWLDLHSKADRYLLRNPLWIT